MIRCAVLMSNKIQILLVAFLQIAAVNAVSARSDDRDKPIHITADTAELNDKTGISIYRGDVEMVQGTTVLTGDVITVHAPDKKIDKVVSVGNLATYRETTDDGKVVYAESEEMIYNRTENKIDLFRRAKITEEDNVFRSEHIVYYIEEELIDAGTTSDRVNITILPDSGIFEKDKTKKIKEKIDAGE